MVVQGHKSAQGVVASLFVVARGQAVVAVEAERNFGLEPLVVAPSPIGVDFAAFLEIDLSLIAFIVCI